MRSLILLNCIGSSFFVIIEKRILRVKFVSHLIKIFDFLSITLSSSFSSHFNLFSSQNSIRNKIVIMPKNKNKQ